jgi:5-hydroxyisourate hydrolase-like protein (transthyretin family)
MQLSSLKQQSTIIKIERPRGKDKVKTIINNTSKNISKIMGMFGIMLALAVMLVGAPAASANSRTATSQGKLTVTVVNETTGAAIPAATVAVYQANSPTAGTPVAKGSTSATGVYATYLSAGSYSVVVAADGYTETNQYVTVEKGYNTSVKAALKSSAEDMAATSPIADGKLSVYALDANTGSAIVQATVVVYDANGNAIAKALTDSNGYFAMVVRPAEYKVQVIASGYADFSEGAGVVPGETTVIKAGLQSTSDR